jgi:hypothetical protein
MAPGEQYLRLQVLCDSLLQQFAPPERITSEEPLCLVHITMYIYKMR